MSPVVNVNAERRLEGDVSLIQGTLKWRAVISGVAPPGMTESDIQAAVMQNISFSVAFGQMWRDIKIEVAPDLDPVQQPQGPKIVS